MSFFLDLSSAIERGEWLYYVVYGSLILVFSYFWVSLMFKPSQIADELKKNGGYVPGVRPGSPTAKFLDFVMTRLTLAGAMFLTLIAVMPDLLFSLYQIPYKIAMFFGGTGMLITVGVLLDTMRQIETQLLQRHYDGFLKKGKSRNRKSGRSQQMIENVGIQEFWVVWKGLIVIASVLFVLGIVASFLNN
jgi:preprotein translocase subunit SecY